MNRQAELVAVLRDIKAQKAAMDEELQPIEEMAREELASLVQAGGTWEDEVGYARYQQDSTRTVWNTKALNALIDNDPQGAYAWLEEYREEKPVKGGLRVK